MAYWDGMTSDPMFWLSALGTGANLYTDYQAREAQDEFNRRQDAYNRQQAAIQAQNAALASQANQYNMAAMSAYPALWGGMMNSYMGALTPMLGGLASFAKSPMDVNKYMQQLSAQEKMAILRQPYAALQARGIQPGGYWDSVTASTLAADAEKRFEIAGNLASKEKDYQLNALLGMLRGFPAFQAPPMMGNFNPQMLPYVPALATPAGMGTPRGASGDPLSDYLKSLAIRKAPNAPQQQTAADTPRSSNMSQDEYVSYLDNLIKDALSG